MVSRGFAWFQMVSHGFGWFHLVSDGFSCGFGIGFAHFGSLEPQKVDPKAQVIPKVCPRLSEGVSQAVGNQRKPAETNGNR